MKKYKKFIISLLTVSTIISNNCYNAFAATEEQGYVENHVDINLTNINLAVFNNKDLVMSVDKSKNVLKQMNGKNNIEKIEKMTERYPEIENDLIEMVNDYWTIVNKVDK